MTSRTRRFFALALAVACAAWSLASCASPTDITVLVTTDFDCTDLHHVTVTVGTLGPSLETAPVTALSTTCEGGYAGRLVVIPSGSKNDVVAIKVTGGFGKTKQAEDCVATYDAAKPGTPSYGPGCIVARRTLHYTPHTPLTVPIVLRSACAGVACGETETCVKGACVPATLADSATCRGEGCGESALGDGGLPAGGGDAGTGDAAATGLLALTLSAGTLSPAFRQATLSYAVVPSVVSLGVPFTVTPTYGSGTSVTINGAAVASGAPSPPIALDLQAPTAVKVSVTSAAGAETHYAIVAPAVQEAYVKASNSQPSVRLGNSVALSGDTLAVGSFYESSNATGINGNQSDTSALHAGAVYVFARSGASWSQQAYLKASNTEAGTTFGASVALSGNTLVVGANDERSNATGINGNQFDTSAGASGAVYVFTRTGASWSQQAYVKASNTRTNAKFGVAVAVAGDTLAVGSSLESSGAVGINGNQLDTSADASGAVYVFTRTGASWSQQAYVKASNTRNLAAFGASVALSGDTLAVGSFGESSNATGINGNQADTSAGYAGAVYVFTRNGTSWTQQAYAKASNTRPNDSFGGSVALSGDTLAVGAINERSAAIGINGNQLDASSLLAGAVYLFTRSLATWSQQAYVKASNTRANARFGDSVALWNDTLAVGAPGESSNVTGLNGDQAATSASSAGAVCVFARRAPAWSQQAYVKASNSRGNAFFGALVTLSGDSLAVGSYGESSNATGVNGNPADTSAPLSGGVYVLR